MEGKWRGVLAGLLVLGGRVSGQGDEAVTELSPYEVEAWHFDGLAMEVPAGVLRLEGDAIVSSGAGSVPELLEKMAGVRFRGYTGNGTEGQLAMRGFGDNSGLRVLVLVDGQAYNAPDMGGINWAGVDVEELEVVEVLRGGQSVIYGNHAVSGVIKLQTRQPGKDLEGRASATLGSDGLKRISAGLGQGFGQFGLRAGGSWSETDGYREHSAGKARSAHLGWRVETKGGSEWSGRFSLDRSELQFPGPLTYAQMLEDPRQSTGSGRDLSETDIRQATLRGRGDWSHGQWQLAGGALDRERAWNLDGVRADNRQKRYTLSPRVKWGGDGRWLMLGMDLEQDQLDYTDYADATGEVIVRSWADVARTTAGAYAFASRELAGDMELSGGLRLENARTDNTYVRYKEEQLRPVLETNRGPYPNPNYKDPPDPDPDLSFDGPVDKSGWAAELSLLKQLRPGLNLWTGWDRVYRYPALDEAAAYQGYPLSDPLNTGLEPETGHNLEAGLKWFGTNWDLACTAFILRMDDEIAYDDVERLNRNIGSTVRRGLEVDFSYRKDRYGTRLHMGLVRAEFRDEAVGRRVPLVPAFEGGISGWWKPVSGLRLQANWRYLSSQFQGNDFANEFREIPGYGLLDLSLGWEPLPGWSLLLAVNNAADRTHAVSAYSGGFYPGAGRTVQGRIRYTF